MSQNEKFPQHIVWIFVVLLLYVVESLHFATSPCDRGFTNQVSVCIFKGKTVVFVHTFSGRFICNFVFQIVSFPITDTLRPFTITVGVNVPLAFLGPWEFFLFGFFLIPRIQLSQTIRNSLCTSECPPQK